MQMSEVVSADYNGEDTTAVDQNHCNKDNYKHIIGLLILRRTVESSAVACL
jgi:hypothetical protein